MASPELLIDTSYAVALVSTGDQYHEAAQQLAAHIRLRFRLVVTQAVCLEIGSSLASSRNRPSVCGRSPSFKPAGGS